MPRHLLRRLAAVIIGIALFAASPSVSRANDAAAATVFLASLTDQAIELPSTASWE